MKWLLLEFLKLSLIAFLLHIVWEYVQCAVFFVHVEIPNTNLAMLYASIGDVILTWIAYLSLVLCRGNWSWYLQPWRALDIFIITLVALVLSISIELYALEIGRWRYTDINPLVMGKVSILPILQLLLLFPLTFKILGSTNTEA
jgi:hypothetical protein